jgi:hypothetical protein
MRSVQCTAGIAWVAERMAGAGHARRSRAVSSDTFKALVRVTPSFQEKVRLGLGPIGDLPVLRRVLCEPVLARFAWAP